LAIGLAGALCALCAPGAAPSDALAARVIVLGTQGHAVSRNDPFLTTPALTPTPSARTAQATGHPQPRAHAADRNVRTELARLRRTRQISTADYQRYLGSFNTALGTVKRLRGTRAVELESVIEIIHGIAASGQLTPSRLPALFTTLDRNRQWWTTGPLLASGQRVEFAGSELVWEYYPGQGIALQELGSFGKADGFYTGGQSYYGRLRQALAELIPLAARRGGGLTWEYYFNFDGGAPPWTSAMSQATAMEALTRGFQAFGDPTYLDVARRALPIFFRGPPVGVTVNTRRGKRYLLYSFAPGPGVAVLNGFLQSLIGLYDYAKVSGNVQAAKLFAAGDREARFEVPHYDTGAWSLYQPGQEATLDYHELVTGFLQELCQRVKAPVYCTTAEHFQNDLKTPPALHLLTGRVAARRPATVSFSLSKVSHVGIVIARGAQTVLATSADFPYGVHAFAIPPLSPGSYTVRLAATDLASNFGRIVGTLQVS
jgi:hypothetical protein